jgi:anti-sigma factor RsiW
MFDCKRFIECLSDYFDGELDPEFRAAFEEHVETCENARAMIRTFERTITLYRETRVTRLSADAHARLLRAVEECIGCQDDSATDEDERQG